VTAIMFVAACNFSLVLKVVFTGKFPYFADEEFRFFTGMVVISILVITPLVYFSSPEVISVTGDPAFLPRTFSNYLRIVAFQVLTIASTTGFCTSDYELWNCPVAILIICALMFPCGCGGSTAGGMKCSRLIVVGKHLINEIKHCVYPRTIASVRLSGERIDDALVAKTLAFVLCYLAIFIAVALMLTITEYRPNAHYRQLAETNLVQADAALEQTQQSLSATDSTAPTPKPYGTTIDVKTAFGASIAAISNIGPGFGHVGPSGDYHWFRPISKILLAITMITGRLELYTILVLFLPSFWRK
ncbi:MAG: TrkH family potassium uptake protein, partial [Victivallales bacterium]|nr:TrkH family potassium uptake protein [Victivallales bacterium]